MKTLKEKIKDNLELICWTFVPYSAVFNEKLKKKIDISNYHVSKGIIYSSANAFISLLETFTLGIFIWGAIETGTINPKKANKILEERLKQEKIERIIQQQNIYRKQFQTLDENENYVIDSTEFIYRNSP